MRITRGLEGTRVCVHWLEIDDIVLPDIDIAVRYSVVWLDVAVIVVAVVDINVAVAAPAVGSAANLRCC